MKHVYCFDKGVMPLAFVEVIVNCFEVVYGGMPVHDGLIYLLVPKLLKHMKI